MYVTILGLIIYSDKVLQEIAPSMADASVGGNVYNWATDPDNVALLGKNTFFGKLASVGKEFVGNVGEFAKTSGLDQISGYVDIINPSKSFSNNCQLNVIEGGAKLEQFLCCCK